MTTEDDLEKGMPISTISPYSIGHRFWYLLERNFGAVVYYLLFYLTRYFKLSSTPLSRSIPTIAEWPSSTAYLGQVPPSRSVISRYTLLERQLCRLFILAISILQQYCPARVTPRTDRALQNDNIHTPQGINGRTFCDGVKNGMITIYNIEGQLKNGIISIKLTLALIWARRALIK